MILCKTETFCDCYTSSSYCTSWQNSLLVYESSCRFFHQVAAHGGTFFNQRGGHRALILSEIWDLLRWPGMVLPVHGTSTYSIMWTALYSVLLMPSVLYESVTIAFDSCSFLIHWKGGDTIIHVYVIFMSCLCHHREIWRFYGPQCTTKIGGSFLVMTQRRISLHINTHTQ